MRCVGRGAPLRRAALLSVVALAVVAGQNVNPNPMDSNRKLPGYRPTHDSVPLLTPITTRRR